MATTIKIKQNGLWVPVTGGASKNEVAITDGTPPSDLTTEVWIDKSSKATELATKSDIDTCVRYPEWFNESLVCWYDPKKLNIKNEEMRALQQTGKPLYLKDFSKNHLDMKLLNFNWKDMSGMGGYPINFKDMTAHPDRCTDIVTSHLWTVTSNKNGMTPIIEYVMLGHYTFNKCHIRINGLKNDLQLIVRHKNQQDANTIYTFAENGIHEIPSCIDIKAYMFQFNKPFSEEKITIEILPSYEGALVFDGVDDFGVSKNQPILDDYTVIAKRKWITKKAHAYLASKRTAAGGEFMFETYTNEDKVIVNSYCKSSVSKPIEGDISYQTKYFYNSTPIYPGDAKGVDELSIAYEGVIYAKFANIALYNFLLFNRTLTEKEINWVKRNIMGESIEDLPKADTIDGTEYLAVSKDGQVKKVTVDEIIAANGGPMRGLFEAAGAKWNQATGFYELNGLTDITEKQMEDIYNETNPLANSINKEWAFAYKGNTRTNICKTVGTIGLYDDSVNINLIFRENKSIEIFNAGALYVSRMRGAFLNCINLKKILGYIALKQCKDTAGYGPDNFLNTINLESLQIRNLDYSISFADSSKLSNMSIYDLIRYAGNKENDITITLHPESYKRAIENSNILTALATNGHIHLINNATKELYPN